MRKRFTEDNKKKYVELYKNGTSVKALCRDLCLSKSAIYNWIRDYSEIKTPSGEYVTAKRLYYLEKKLDRINRENEILRNSGCMPQSPMEERIQAVIRLKDQYNIHVLCDTLEVRRSVVVESFNSCLKSEELNRYCYRSFEELQKSVEDYIAFYNNDRPHQSLKYKTPNAVESDYNKKRAGEM